MNEKYIKLDSAVKALTNTAAYYEDFDIYAANIYYQAAEILQKQSPADVERVIRCGRCEHGIPRKNGLLCERIDKQVEALDFCSYGKERT